MRPIVAAGPNKPTDVYGTAGDDTIIVNVQAGETIIVYPGSGNDLVRINGAEDGNVIIYDFGFSNSSGDDTYILNGGSVTLVYDLDPFSGVPAGGFMDFGHDQVRGFTSGNDFLDLRAAAINGEVREIDGETRFGDAQREHVLVDAINLREAIDYFM